MAGFQWWIDVTLIKEPIIHNSKLLLGFFLFFFSFFNLFVVPMDFSVTDNINTPVSRRKYCVLACIKKLQQWNVLIRKSMCVCIWNIAQNVLFLCWLAMQYCLCFQWINPGYWSGSLMSTDEDSSAKWIIVAWSPQGLAALVLTLFPLFSSWVIATAPITRGKHTGDKTYNQRSTLGKAIWNIRQRAFGMYSVKANIGTVPFLPLGHILGSLLQHSHNFIFLLKKYPKETLISFLTEILRGNKRQSYFGIHCSLVPHRKALFGVSSWCLWAVLRLSSSSAGHLSLLRSPSESRVATVRGQAVSGWLPAGESRKAPTPVAPFAPCSLLGAASCLEMCWYHLGHCQGPWRSRVAVSVHSLSRCPVVLDYPYSQSVTNTHHFHDWRLRESAFSWFMHLYFFHGVFTSIIFVPVHTKGKFY